SFGFSAQPTYRFGPTTPKPVRIPMRLNSAGSVRMRTPKKSMSTVACPNQQTVILLSDHAAGVGFTGADGICRRASATTVRNQRADRRGDVAAQYAPQAVPASMVPRAVTNLRPFPC